MNTTKKQRVTGAEKRRRAILQSWLVRMRATKLIECRGPNGSSLVFYAINDQCVIVQHFLRLGGFEIFVPPCTSGLMDDTFLAAEKMLGIAAPLIAEVQA